MVVFTFYPSERADDSKEAATLVQFRNVRHGVVSKLQIRLQQQIWLQRDDIKSLLESTGESFRLEH